VGGQRAGAFPWMLREMNRPYGTDFPVVERLNAWCIEWVDRQRAGLPASLSEPSRSCTGGHLVPSVGWNPKTGYFLEVYSIEPSAAKGKYLKRVSFAEGCVSRDGFSSANV